MKKRILVVDDEPAIVTSLKMTLEPTHEVLCASTAQEAIDRFRQELPNLVLLDLILPGADGLKVLELMRSEDPSVPVIMLTAIKTVKTAVDAMKIGAADYLTKPFDIEELRLVVAKTLTTQELEQEVRYLRAQVANSYSFHNLVGKSPAMREIYSKIEQVADTRATVLITGESGTGKELVARALHAHSPRAQHPFLALNCAAVPETLIESELFGHEKGAFTGAQAKQIGLFEAVDQGTLFLDEIGDLSLSLQAKLLRVLQEKEIRRIGGREDIKVDVRVVAATNRKLATAIKQGTFREDLFYRLNVVSIHVPPLRDRTTDIPELIEHFLKKYAASSGKAVRGLTEGALQALLVYHWPGNVRELESVIERAVLLCDGGRVDVEDLPAEVRTRATLLDKMDFDLPADGFSLEEFERRLLETAMARSNGVIAKAAKMLGLTYKTMQYRLEKFQIGRGPSGGKDIPPEVSEEQESRA